MEKVIDFFKFCIRNFLKYFGLILLSIVIIVFNFIIGDNSKELRVLPICVLMFFIILFLSVKKIRNKGERIFIKNKVDGFVLVFMATMFLPLIFRTYCSYSDTIDFIIKYFFIYSVYILARNSIDSNKKVNFIVYVTLFSSLIPVVLGLDMINGNYLDKFTSWLNLGYEQSSLFSGTFGYANAVAIYMSFCLFLAINVIKNNKYKVVKGICVLYSLFIFYIIWITIARTIIALLLLILGIYFLVSGRKYIKKYWKIFGGVGLVLIVIIGSYLAFSLRVSEPFEITEQSYWTRLKYNFKEGEEYKLELDVETRDVAKVLKNSAFELQIIEGNKYFKESKISSTKFGDVNGKVEIKFTPNEDFSYINLRILNDFHGKINLRKCYINDDEYIINFKYIPNKIGKMFYEYSLKEKSLKERGYIYSDCIKMAKQSPIIGHGGNTWHVLSSTVQEYSADLKESHSYFFELLISYGIVGVIAFCIVLISLIVKLVKQFLGNKDSMKDKLLIIIGLFFMVLECFVFDFSMSFMVIQVIVYTYFAILIFDDKEEIKLPKFIDYFLVVFLVFVFSFYVRNCISEYCVSDVSDKRRITSYKSKYCYNEMINQYKNDGDTKECLDNLQRFMKNEPYDMQTEMYYLYFTKIFEDIDELSEDELDEYLSFGLDRMKKIEFNKKLYLNYIMGRTSVIVESINNLEEYISKLPDDNSKKDRFKEFLDEFESLLKEEYDENMKNLENGAGIDSSEKEIESFKTYYTKYVNEKGNK